MIKKLLRQKYILASKSLRRIKLLKQINLNFTPEDSGVKEADGNSHSPVACVRHNSRLKAKAVAIKHKSGIVIGADTIVALAGKILGKPKNKQQAELYLKRLSGKKHIVYTGIYLINTADNKELFSYEKTSVYFRVLSADEIKYYVNTHTPLDKAGAYGIQDDFGCLFVSKINGDYYNVVGLPLTRLYVMLKQIV
jgi:septum formation protein